MGFGILEFSCQRNEEEPEMSRKLCTICNTRTAGTGKGTDPQHALSMGYCAPCLEEAEWENTHSDDGHDHLIRTLEVGRQARVDNIAQLEAEVALEIEGCWICHPELNEAQKAHTPREGHANTIAKNYTSHANCNHASTPADRAKCRKIRAANIAAMGPSAVAAAQKIGYRPIESPKL